MKGLGKVWTGAVLLLLAAAAAVNFWIWKEEKEENARFYRVEISCVCKELERREGRGTEEIPIQDLTYITRIVKLSEGMDEAAFLQGDGADYVIRRAGGAYYRIEYDESKKGAGRAVFFTVNAAMAVMAAAVLGILLYIQINLVKPFAEISRIPYELSKGNLTAGLKENKNRFFGKFVWGLDVLREKLEQDRQKELDLQKEKKTLILSVSHDIKTPLSAIKLYAKALSKNLYDTEEKQREIAESINRKADEIEAFVSEIIKASNEDFLNLPVQQGEFYLSGLLEEIDGYCREKLELLRIPYNCQAGCNCLVRGDLDRAAEVIQNLMENAVKYGDGGYIRIEVTAEEDCRLVTVRNSGCTLPETELPHIFDSFWRGSNTGNNGGSGLGLYICRQLMQKMDGDIYAEKRQKEMAVTAVFRMV